MRYRACALVALAAQLLSSSLQGQWTSGTPGSGGDMGDDGGTRGGPGHGGRGGMFGRPHGHRLDIPTPEELEGPLAPTAMSGVADLDSAGTARYAERYAPYMTSTAPVRDSLRVILRTLRDDMESGDRDAMRAEMQEHGPVISRLWKDLSKRDKQFYTDATKAFTSEERKKFEQWQEDEKKAHEADHRRGPGAAERRGWT